jgi:ABC-type multidrug transport system permease subunit
MKPALTRTILPFVLAVAFGCLAVSVDIHNDEVQAAVLVLLVAGFLVGGIWPVGAWRWALVLGLSIVVGDYAAPQLHLVARDPEPINWGALIAIVPAFLGTYLGVGMRRVSGMAAGSPAKG